MKTGFISPLRVENVDAKTWRLTDDFVWRGSKGDTFSVYIGDTTDFASVPWWTQTILPRTGTWTKAAVLHDKMCDMLNEYYRLKSHEAVLREVIMPYSNEIASPCKPVFNSVDTDAVFRKNARESGTDPIRSELLWFGVRCGALSNPARRTGWLSTFPRWFADLVWILGAAYAVTLFVLWVAHW